MPPERIMLFMRAWACGCGGGSFPGSDLPLRFVAAPRRAAPLAMGGRCLSRYVSGDGDQTDYVFSSSRSTKCPVELLGSQTSVYVNICPKCSENSVLGDYLRRRKLFLQIPLLRIFFTCSPGAKSLISSSSLFEASAGRNAEK